jgi:uncharacterized protein (DUF362 family)
MTNDKFSKQRRDCLRILGAGALGGLLVGPSNSLGSVLDKPTFVGSTVRPPYKKHMDPATVSLVKGDNRREIIYQSMMNLKDEIIEAIGNKKVLIKPNLVVYGSPGCETHPDAVRGVLDFVRKYGKSEIIVGESTASRDKTTMDCFQFYGYFPLRDEYGIKLVDLNREPSEARFILGAKNNPVAIRVISDFLNPDIFVISLARMKVHVHAYVTLALKNLLMAAPVNDYTNPELGWKTGDKFNMHVTPESPPTDPLFYNLYLLSQHVYPDLSVIDGFQGMSDRGPVGGHLVDSRVALAGLDALATDVTATRVMGLDPDIVPYFNFMKEAGIGQANKDKIKLVGTPFNDCIYQYKAARTFNETSIFKAE